MRREAGRNVAYRVLQILSVAVVALHFALTFLYVAPVNPLKVALRGLLARTVGTYLRQDWRIFAPAPLNTDDALLVRCLSAHEAAANTLSSSGWYDLSSPLWKGNQENRFSAYARLSRVLTYSARTHLQGTLELMPLRQACQAGSEEACRAVEESVARTRVLTGPTLRRIGTAACRDLSPSAAAVALRVRRTFPVPWSERHSRPAPKFEDLPIGVFRVDPAVEAPGLYRSLSERHR